MCDSAGLTVSVSQELESSSAGGFGSGSLRGEGVAVKVPAVIIRRLG